MRNTWKNRSILLAAISALSASTAFAQTTVTWSGPGTGNWNVNGNWTGGVFPNNSGGTRYNVLIDDGGATNVNVTLPTAVFINNFSLSSGDVLTVNTSSSMRVLGDDVVGAIHNQGTIILSAANSEIYITGATITLDGGGTILMNSSTARVRDSGTLNNVNNLIIGQGAYGLGQTNLINSGTITASAGTLSVDAGTVSGMTNTGTMSALAGGTLEITGSGGGSFTGAGTILANGGIVRLIGGASITSANFGSSGGGNVLVPTGQTAGLSNVNFTGDFVLGNASIVNLSGTNSNSGTITIASTGGNTALQASGGAVLSGSGTIVMSHANSFIQGSGVLDTSNTIRGVGQIGSNAIGLISGGSIICDVPGGKLTIDPNPTSGMLNNGTIIARSGSTITLSGTGGGSFSNGASGHMIADGGTIEITGSPIVAGGTLSTLNGGTIMTAGLTGATLRSVTNLGSYFVQNGTPGNFEGTIVNSGTITVAGTGGNTNFQLVGGTVTMNGGGTIVLTHALAAITNGGTLITDNTIRGFGAIGNNSVAINTSGTINATGGNLICDSSATSTFMSSGPMIASSGATLTLSGSSGGTFNLTGPMTVQSGGTVAIIQSPLINAATVSLDGNMTMNGGTSNFGRMEGSGTYTQINPAGFTSATRVRIGGVSVNSGTVSINSNGTDAETVSRLGTISVTVSGRFDLNDNDLIVTTTPKATVQALIVAARNAGSWNGVGITSSAAKNAVIKATTLGMISGSDWFAISSNGNPWEGQSIIASDTLVKYTYYGDANFNGKVDGGDFARLDTTFALEKGQGNIGGWVNGDFDYNNKVDGSDYGLADFAFGVQSGSLAGMLLILSGEDDGSSGSEESFELALVRRHLGDFGDVYRQTFINQLPEPGCAMVMAAMSMHALLRRRRRD